MTTRPGVASAAFAVLASRIRYRGWSSVRSDTLSDGRGGTIEREVVEHDDAVAVVAVDRAGRVALVRQYRHPTGGHLLEVPAGTLDDPSETVEAAARRELAEEVGLAAGRLRPLGSVWNSAGWSDERTSLWLATDLVRTGAPEGFVADAEEAAMEVVWRALDDLVREALDGTLCDAKTVIGILRAATVVGASTADAGSDAPASP